MFPLRHVPPAILAVALILTACGGGGGSTDASRQLSTNGTDVTTPPPVVDPTPEPQATHGPATVTFHSTSGGHDARAIVEYLRAAAGGGGPAHVADNYSFTTDGLFTFANPPTVHLASGTPPHLREIAARAVDNINRWLPYAKRIRIAADVDPRTPLADVPEGQIFVEFADPRHWRSQGSDAVGNARTSVTPEHAYAARIRIAPDGTHSVLTTTMHELLHTLAVHAHISRQRLPDTIMDTRSGSARTVPAIDGEALLAAYTRFAPGTHPDDISIETLGPWATEKMHLQGEIPAGADPVTFGVSFRNGLAHPWARGAAPDTAIAANAALSGTAEWNGTLLGFTPEGRTAAGDARIGLDLTTLAGTADFNDIETWSEAPGATGTGTPWGDLAYTISVTGNAFRNTGGDAGELKGSFVGPRHEGAAGTLERADLTAAFGATR